MRQTALSQLGWSHLSVDFLPQTLGDGDGGERVGELRAEIDDAGAQKVVAF